MPIVSVEKLINGLEPEERHILSAIALSGARTREKLLSVSPWGRSKTDAIAKKLSDAGLVEVKEARADRKGRSRYEFSVSRDIGVVIGIELSPSGDRFVVSDFNCSVIAQDEFENSIDKPDVIASLEQNLLIALQQWGIAPEKVAAICIGVHGLSNEQAGIVRRFLHHDEEVAISFREYFGGKYGFPAYIGRPKHLICLKEYGNSYIARKKTFINVNIGFGVGLSFFVEGRYYPGASGLSGEFGHVMIGSSDRPCYCGNRGCLRTIASYKGICTEALDRLDEFERAGVTTRLDRTLLSNPNYEIGVEHVIDQALEHEKISVHLINDVGKHVGATLATVISVLNPEILTIHTDLVRAGDYFIAPLSVALRRNALAMALRDLRVEYSSWPRFAVAEGATVLALIRLLNGVDAVQ